MPSLEDIPSLVSRPVPSGSDILPLFDVTEVGNSRIKKSTLLQIFLAGAAALPGPYIDDATAALAGIAVGGFYLNGDGATAPNFIAQRLS